MKRWIIVPLLLAAGLAGVYWTQRSGPVEVPYTKPVRQTIESVLNTNGKVEPLEFVLVRASRDGRVMTVPVQKGRLVGQGQTIAELDSSALEAQLAGAEARIAQAKAELSLYQGGGRPADLSVIDSQVATQQQALKLAQQDLEVAKRLQQKQAATSQQVQDAQRLVDAAQLQLSLLSQRRQSLVGNSDRQGAQAKIADAEAVARETRIRIEQGLIRSPLAGMVYQLDVKPGAFVNPGDLIGGVGRLATVRVRLYIDEPDLGKISMGTPVKISWDAYPGRVWRGTIDRLPTEVVALGSRQVGEVTCLVDNADLVLLPGTNVNAEVEAAVVKEALTIPRETLRRQDNHDGVMVLEGDMAKFRPIKVGVSSVTRFQVVEGLKDGDLIALPMDRELKPGTKVKPKSE